MPIANSLSIKSALQKMRLKLKDTYGLGGSKGRLKMVIKKLPQDPNEIGAPLGHLSQQTELDSKIMSAGGIPSVPDPKKSFYFGFEKHFVTMQVFSEFKDGQDHLFVIVYVFEATNKSQRNIREGLSNFNRLNDKYGKISFRYVGSAPRIHDPWDEDPSKSGEFHAGIFVASIPKNTQVSAVMHSLKAFFKHSMSTVPIPRWIGDGHVHPRQKAGSHSIVGKEKQEGVKIRSGVFGKYVYVPKHWPVGGKVDIELK